MNTPSKKGAKKGVDHRTKMKIWEYVKMVLFGLGCAAAALMFACPESSFSPSSTPIQEHSKPVEPVAANAPYNAHPMGLEEAQPGYFGAKDAKILIVSAYDGEKYMVMGNLAAQTKNKYAEIWGYHHSIDNEILAQKANNFNAKSAGRTDVYRKHMDKGYDWIVWTDSDVLITNPRFRLEDIIEKYAPEGSNMHVIMARDWGGGQPQTGVMFLKCSDEGRRLLDEWDHQIELDKIHDDLLAIKTMEAKKMQPYYGWMAWTKDMWELQSYPHLELKEVYNSKGPEHNENHAIWADGDYMVHVVNCLRQSYRIDVAACDGIAAWYWDAFWRETRRMELGLPSLGSTSFDDDKVGPITVISATYGTDKKEQDVSKKMQSDLDHYWNSRKTNRRWTHQWKIPQDLNEKFGDPVPGETKRLKVVYHGASSQVPIVVEVSEYGEAQSISFLKM